ncbi:MAG: YeeE/YedE family protein [Proteobacteria bacterium]|nr:MAG: YeeE/YedE family protein [Pseudomonadota bacterium]
MPLEWIYALIGGVLIGASATLMLYWNGRVTGISGIVNNLFTKNPTLWRWGFVVGLLAGGVLLRLVRPEVFVTALDAPRWTVPVAGLLVGFGTAMGGGCTSGHGVCGISRFSLRSVVATIVFIAAGVCSVLAFQMWEIIG